MDGFDGAGDGVDGAPNPRPLEIQGLQGRIDVLTHQVQMLLHQDQQQQQAPQPQPTIGLD